MTHSSVVANTTQLAAKNGVLIRDRSAIDTARNLDVIAIDKTGTLTTGKVGLIGIKTTGEMSRDEALSLAKGGGRNRTVRRDIPAHSQVATQPGARASR